MHAAFDSDVVIYAASHDHPLGPRILRVIHDADVTRTGSVLLLPEVLAKPMREGSSDVPVLRALLGAVEMRPFDESTPDVATYLASMYRLRAADAVHLATAVIAGADTFLTNNRKDFPTSIGEIDIVYPDELPEP